MRADNLIAPRGADLDFIRSHQVTPFSPHLAKFDIATLIVLRPMPVVGKTWVRIVAKTRTLPRGRENRMPHPYSSGELRRWPLLEWRLPVGPFGASQRAHGSRGSHPNFVADGALSLLLVAVLAIALSTMSSAFSASVCAIRYDILPAFSAEPRSEKTPPVEEARATGRALTASGTLCLVIFGAFYAVGAHRPMGFTGSGFLAPLFAFFCAQLSFVPLVLGPLIGRTRGRAVSPGWALGVIGCGAVVGVGSVAIYLTSGSEPWLWAAVPASLGSGFLIFIVARLATTSATPHSAT